MDIVIRKADCMDMRSQLLVVAVKQQMSHLMGKPTMWLLNRSETNQALQAHKMARGWKFRI